MDARDNQTGPSSLPLDEPKSLRPYWRRLDLSELADWDCAPLRPIVDDMIAHGNFVFVAAASQTGKSLFALHLFQRILHGGRLFGRFKVHPVRSAMYIVLEDPDRRVKARLQDMEHEFPAEIERGRGIFRVAPGFSFTDDEMGEMWRWFKDTIKWDKPEVVFLDTYQKATPGLNSFDDEKQSRILHRLSDLTKELGITLIVLDHVRKPSSSGGGRGRKKGMRVTLDDVKGTGGKVQNADGVILMERGADRSKIQFSVFSKDFDRPVQLTLNVAPQGSEEPKFSIVAGEESADLSAQNRRVLDALEGGAQLSVAQLATQLGVSASTVGRSLDELEAAGRAHHNDKVKGRRWSAGPTPMPSVTAYASLLVADRDEDDEDEDDEDVACVH